MLETALEYASSRRESFLRKYETFLAIPSISTLPQHAGDVQRAARWLADELGRLGMHPAEIVPTPLHPIVYAERLGAPGKPTLLVYGHYDVQPADPLGEWASDPFVPTVRGENMYARGASDMKGALVAFLEAVDALSRAGGLPLNLKFLVEGEEEVGSPSLAEFIRKRRDALRADAILNCDGEIHSPTRPSITYALRGLAYFEIEVHGPRQDLHSGIFGGSLHNPAQVLCDLIAGMHDGHGRVTLPGFYDKVHPLDAAERAALARAPMTDDEWKALAGVPALWGEAGYTTVERLGARPTLEVNGLVSGFIGEGAKTILPAKALAKISTRLVADQDPAEVYGQLCAYLRQHAPLTVTWEARELSRGPGAIMARDSTAMRAAVDALRETFGAEPFFKREGGSVPVVGLMQDILGVDSVMLGFRLPDDNIHGPNEKQHLPTLFKGVEVYIRFLTGLAAAEL
jgi:acetylornithine deacetylase/succinyl-diaminopimelate desuccinylase-like protein